MARVKDGTKFKIGDHLSFVDKNHMYEVHEVTETRYKVRALGEYERGLLPLSQSFVEKTFILISTARDREVAKQLNEEIEGWLK